MSYSATPNRKGSLKLATLTRAEDWRALVKDKLWTNH